MRTLEAAVMQLFQADAWIFQGRCSSKGEQHPVTSELEEEARLRECSARPPLTGARRSSRPSARRRRGARRDPLGHHQRAWAISAAIKHVARGGGAVQRGTPLGPHRRARSPQRPPPHDSDCRQHVVLARGVPVVRGDGRGHGHLRVQPFPQHHRQPKSDRSPKLLFPWPWTWRWPAVALPLARCKL